MFDVSLHVCLCHTSEHMQACKKLLERQIATLGWTAGPWNDAKLDFEGFYVGRLARACLSPPAHCALQTSRKCSVPIPRMVV